MSHDLRRRTVPTSRIAGNGVTARRVVAVAVVLVALVSIATAERTHPAGSPRPAGIGVTAVPPPDVDRAGTR